MRIVSFGEFVKMPRPNTNWIVDELVPRPGMVQLIGPPKVGKSFLALDLAFKVSRGEPFMGRATKASKVLYLQLDTSEKIMRDRGLALRNSGYDIVAPNLCMVHPDDTMRPVNIMFAGGHAYLHKAISTIDPALVVVDTLREIHQEDENDSTAMKIVLDALETLCIGRSVLLVHHTRKISPDEPNPTAVGASRGSNYITGKVDSFWLLYNGRLEITSRWGEPMIQTAKQGANGMFSFA